MGCVQDVASGKLLNLLSSGVLIRDYSGFGGQHVLGERRMPLQYDGLSLSDGPVSYVCVFLGCVIQWWGAVVSSSGEKTLLHQ